MNVPEGQERGQAECNRTRRRKQFVLDKHLVLVLGEKKAFLDDGRTDLVGKLGHRLGIKVDNVLVSPRFIYVSVTVDTEIEALAVNNQILVEIRKEHILVSAEPVEGNCKKAVIAAGIAVDNGCVAIGAGLVGSKNLPLERVREIHEFRFVEFK